MWTPGAMDGIGADEPVLIVGTGSTGIDALLELHHRGHRGTIHLLSRRGLLPLIDAPPQAYAFTRTSIASAPGLREVFGRAPPADWASGRSSRTTRENRHWRG